MRSVTEKSEGNLTVVVKTHLLRLLQWFTAIAGGVGRGWGLMVPLLAGLLVVAHDQL